MDSRVQTVIALMKKDLQRGLPQREPVRAVNLSHSHLRRLFKAEVGMSTSRYMKFLRMEHAKYLFESSFLSVKEVMRTVGINNRSHFVKDFKKLYGRTPTQLRLSRPTDGHTNTTPPAKGESVLAG